jgi:LmbE family N-acetylglucosaminyl deacetylase
MDYRKFVQANHDLFVEAGGLRDASENSAVKSTVLNPDAEQATLFSPDDTGEEECPLLTKPDFLPAHPVVLIVSPHPDDECLMGAYALRMQEEWGAHVWVLPYSFGSKLERQVPRAEELLNAVNHLGFRLVERGFEKIKDEEFLSHLQGLHPDVIFSPHADDGHPAHEAAHQMVKRVTQTFLQASPGGFLPKKILWVQTEFWHAQKNPNLLVPLSVNHVVKVGEALALHAGEVARNPYHLRLPAWFMDQVRRGSERVQAPGSSAVFCVFGQIYFQGILASPSK